MESPMDKEPKQENPSLLSPTTKDHHDSSPRKSFPAVAGASGNAGGDRLKRDEWSEGAVSSLLEAYESKWVLRNRAKLKGHDWEEVARYVSGRSNSTKSPKTQTQCKNKIESMKKRYRSESATSEISSWPLFHRLDLLLRGSSGSSLAPATAASPVAAAPPAQAPPASNCSMMLIEPLPPPPAPPQQILSLNLPAPVMVSAPAPAQPPAPVLPLDLGITQNSIDSNGVDRGNKEDVADTKLSDHQPSNKIAIETDSSTPALYSDEKDKQRSKCHKTRIIDGKKRRRKEENWGIAESIRWLAEVIVRSEQARVDTMRELEKMRADAEVKRGEIDLKRTEIIANTQLEIARLFATGMGKGVDPSLRIGRS